MNPEHEHLAELATRPLEARPELREEARGEVLGRLAHGGGDLTEAIGRLAARRPRSSWRRIGFALAALVALILCAAWQGRQALSEASVLQGLMSLGSHLDFEDPLRESLDPETREYVFAGIGSDQEAVANLQRQWERHPDEPGIYEELVHRCLAANQKLPADYPATWRRFDPDNGLWLYLEAVGKNEEWKKSGPPAGESFSPEVVGLLRQSAAAPRFESYLPALRIRRLDLLPPSDTLAKETAQFLFSISALWAPSVRYEREAVLTFGKAAERAVAEKDAAELAALIASWERFIGRLAACQTTMLELIIPASGWNETGKILLQASRDLGLREEETRLDDLMAKFAAYRAVYGSRSAVDSRPMNSLARILFVGSSISSDPALFEPGRRAEHALADRMLGLAAAILVLLFLAGAVIEGSRRGRRVNGLADGLAPLFRPVDFLWVTGLGVVLPVAWYLVITRGTPLGIRDIGATHFKPQPVLIQAGTAWVLSLLAIVQAAKWRIGARTGMLALKPARPWVGWTMTALAAAVIPAAGGVRWLSGNEERYLQAIAATGGLSLLWLLWEAGAVAFSPRDHSLGGVMLCRRMVAPLALLAALLLAGWGPLLATERHWHARDQISRADRNHGGMSFMEGQVVELLRDRFREAFPAK